MTKSRPTSARLLSGILDILHFMCRHLIGVSRTGDRIYQILVLEAIPKVQKACKSDENVGSCLRKDRLCGPVLKEFSLRLSVCILKQFSLRLEQRRKLYELTRCGYTDALCYIQSLYAFERAAERRSGAE